MMHKKTKSSASKARVDAQIETSLKRAFDEVLDEGIPQRFTDLLEQLRAQEVDKSKNEDAK